MNGRLIIQAMQKATYKQTTNNKGLKLCRHNWHIKGDFLQGYIKTIAEIISLVIKPFWAL
jgi:hypothetical protein